MHLPVDSDVRDRIERLQIPFSKSGVDPYGITKEHLGFFMSMLKPRWAGGSHGRVVRVKGSARAFASS